MLSAATQAAALHTATALALCHHAGALLNAALTAMMPLTQVMLSAAVLAAAAGPATALTTDGLAPAKGATLKQEGAEGARPPSPFGEASQEEEEEEPELLFAPDLIISQVGRLIISGMDAFCRAWDCQYSHQDWCRVICAVQRQSAAGAEGA